MIFQQGTVVDYPIPPAVTISLGTHWRQAVPITQTTRAAWADSPAKDNYKKILFQKAQTRNAHVQHSLNWDDIPIKDNDNGLLWQSSAKRDNQQASPWASTQATDPAPAPIPWDDSAITKEANTAALWGQPPAKDQHYAGPWFRVDTTGPEWNIKDHRPPPLWADPPNALAFSFQDAVYIPHKVPAIFFHFDGRIASHPVQPKDNVQQIPWKQSKRKDLSPSDALGRRTVWSHQGQSSNGRLWRQGCASATGTTQPLMTRSVIC